MLVSTNIFQDVDAAGDYVSSIWDDFASQQGKLQAEFSIQQSYAVQAQATGNNSAYVEFVANAKEINNALQDWTDIYTQLLPYATFTGLACGSCENLGQWNIVAYVAGGIAGFLLAAGYLYNWYSEISLKFARWNLSKTAYDQGKLTPLDVLQQNPTDSGGFSGLLKNAGSVLIIGLVGYGIIRSKKFA